MTAAHTVGSGEIDAWLAPVRKEMSPEQYVLFVRRVRAADEHADWRPILAEVLAATPGPTLARGRPRPAGGA